LYKHMDRINQTRLLKRENRLFEFKWSKVPHDPEWDEFLVSVPDGHHEQTSLWGQVRACYGWQIARYTLKEQDRIVAGAQAIIKKFVLFGRFAYITYGPCIAMNNDRLLTELCLDELKNFFTELRVLGAVVGLPYSAHNLSQLLLDRGFIKKPPYFPPRFLEMTLVIDLDKSLDDIFSEMRPKKRRNIRLSLRKGITIVEGGEQDLETFHRLMLALCKRTNRTPNPSERDFFQQLWKMFSPKGWIKLFLAMYDQEPVSAAIAFSFRDWFRVWKIGWSGQHGNIKPNDAMWWELIQYARRTGHRYVDFVELDPQQINEMRERNLEKPLFENVTSYKMGFGGEVQELPGTYLYFPNPVIRLVMNRWLVRFMELPIAQHLAERRIRH